MLPPTPGARWDEALVLQDASTPPPLDPSAAPPSFAPPRQILVTGGTGAIGAAVIRALLGDADVTVHALVRGRDAGDASRRLRERLGADGPLPPGEAARLVVHPGDLAAPRLGLPEDTWEALAEQLDALVHAGGLKGTALPYERLRGANVIGTGEALRLAGARRRKPLHFLSSLAVFFSDAHPPASPLTEADAPAYHPTLPGAYVVSKWAADRQVAAAGAQGLPVCIHRPVRVTGDQRTGALREPDDLLYPILKASVLLGAAPDLGVDVTLAPVDYVAGAVAHLALRPAPGAHAYHYATPRPAPWRAFAGLIAAHGYPLALVPEVEWRQEIARRARPNATPDEGLRRFYRGLQIALAFPHPLFRERPPIDDRALRAALEGAGLSCPPVDAALVGIYLKALVGMGYLPAPEGAAAAVGAPC